MASFVARVEVKEKDRASMELLPMPEGYGLKFVTRSQMGAERSRSLNRLWLIQSFGEQRRCFMQNNLRDFQNLLTIQHI
jgi:hypothetical protein